MNSSKENNRKERKNRRMKIEPDFVTLAEVAKTTPYSQEYLSLLARQGKLPAKKFGRNWYTTQEALNGYLTNQGLKIVLPKNFFNTSYKGKINKAFNVFPFGGVDYQKIPKAVLAQIQPPEEPIDFSEALSEKSESRRRDAEPPVQSSEEMPKKEIEEEVQEKILTPETAEAGPEEAKEKEEKVVPPQIIRTMQKDIDELKGIPRPEIKEVLPEKETFG